MEVKCCFILRIKLSSWKPSGVPFTFPQRGPQMRKASCHSSTVIRRPCLHTFQIISLPSSLLDSPGFPCNQMMYNHLEKKNKTNIYLLLWLKELDSMEITGFHSGCADVTRNPRWPPFAQTCQCVGGPGWSRPLLRRPQLGLSPWAGGPLMSDHLQGEYVISKQNLDCPLHSHSLSCAGGHSCGCGHSSPRPGSPEALLGYKQAGLWWQEESGVLILVLGYATSLFWISNCF